LASNIAVEVIAGSGFDSSASKPADAIPSDPIIFSKVPECVIASGAAIRMPRSVSEAIDYEAELAVIIGREARNVSERDALDFVLGYTSLPVRIPS
jgi:2-keto-4-pentenoate hydratase/2-oxohepta-3-ene-1,7-dioic acid hydratase in catechol pathway